MNDASHLGGNCGQRLSAQIRTVAVSGNVALEFVAETIFALTNGDLSGNPQAAPQACVSKLRKARLSAILTRLLGREVKTAELEELPVMAEAAQVTSLCDDGQGNDRANAWYLPECLIIGTAMKERIGKLFDLVTLTDQATSLGDDHSEHPDSRRIEGKWQPDGGSGCLVNI
jgi:hypothetical protein